MSTTEILEQIEIDLGEITTDGVNLDAGSPAEHQELTNQPEAESEGDHVLADGGNEAAVGCAAVDLPPSVETSPQKDQGLNPASDAFAVAVDLEWQLMGKRAEVSGLAVDLAVARDVAKAAKKSLDVAVEELQELEAKAKSAASLLIAKTAAPAREPPGDSLPTSRAVEPAAPAPAALADRVDISELDLSLGREEKLRLADITTIGQLEKAIGEGRLQQVKGFGPMAVDAVTDALMAWMDKHPVAGPAIGDPDEAITALRAAGLDAWDKVSNPEEFVKGGSEPPDPSPEVSIRPPSRDGGNLIEAANLPIIESCNSCGACCMEQGSPPEYVMFISPSPNNYADWPGHDFERFNAMPQEALQILKQYRTKLIRGEIDHSSGHDGPCVWLNQETRQCRFYEHRPQICRDFKMGSDECHGWRKVYQIETMEKA